MFNHLLVPLDGSSLAEAVLPYVRLLATPGTTTISLLHLIERGAPASIHGERHLRSIAEAEAYLAEIAAALRADGFTAETHVDTNEGGDTAGRIADHAVEWGADLALICAHGRGGVTRWLFGSIAQKVLAASSTPVLLVRPTGATRPRTVTLHTILAPLDGTPEAEVGLPLVVALSREHDATAQLVMVVPTAEALSGVMSSIARFSPRVTDELLDTAGEEAATYLDATAARLTAQGAHVGTAALRGEPVGEIVAAARKLPADLIVMASHGRQGLDGVWAGSVGNTVVSRLATPVLLLRAPGAPHKIG